MTILVTTGAGFLSSHLCERLLKDGHDVLRLAGSSSKIVFQPLPLGDPKQRCSDITLAQQHLAWTPKVGLDDGLQETIGYFRREFAS